MGETFGHGSKLFSNFHVRVFKPVLPSALSIGAGECCFLISWCEFRKAVVWGPMIARSLSLPVSSTNPMWQWVCGRTTRTFLSFTMIPAILGQCGFCNALFITSKSWFGYVDVISMSNLVWKKSPIFFMTPWFTQHIVHCHPPVRLIYLQDQGSGHHSSGQELPLNVVS